MSKADLTSLNKTEEENLKTCLLDFVVRVSSPNKSKTPEEVAILPEMTKIVIENLVELYRPNTD